MRVLLRTPGQSVGIEDGRIIDAGRSFNLVLDLPQGEIRPGLINAHDHLHRNHYGRLGEPPYANAYDWAHDIQARHRKHIAARRRGPRRAALLSGAWKNLFCGVTTVVHHDPWEPDFENDFPLRVARIDSADSLGMAPDLSTIRHGRRFCLHMAEGVDAAAAEEVRTLAVRGLLTRRLLAVHGVGVDGDGIERLQAADAGLVWCPTSNLFLFGRTAPKALLDSDVAVLLGSDSKLTAEGDLLDELRCARALGVLDDRRLTNAVGSTAARRLGLPAPTLSPGAAADLVVLTAPLLAASAQDVALVMVAGVVRVARPDIVPALGPLAGAGRPMTLGRLVRWTHSGAGMAHSWRLHI